MAQYGTTFTFICGRLQGYGPKMAQYGTYGTKRSGPLLSVILITGMDTGGYLEKIRIFQIFNPHTKICVLTRTLQN